MNRLSPLIARRTGPFAPGLTLAGDATDSDAPMHAGWAEDAKLFVLGWLGGLVFFGTILA